MYPLHTEFGISRQILGWERKKCEGGVRSPAELTLSSNPNHGQLMLKFYKKKYSVMLYIFHKNALLTSNFNENFLGAINAPFPPIYFVWKVDTAHFSAFRCVHYDVGYAALCIWGISPTIFVSLPQQNCFISPTICFVSPTKLLHFPNNLSHFPNNLCHFPNTFSHFPNNFVSLCPPPKNLFFFFLILLVFHISTSLHHFDKS